MHLNTYYDWKLINDSVKFNSFSINWYDPCSITGGRGSETRKPGWCVLVWFGFHFLLSQKVLFGIYKESVAFEQGSAF